MTNNLLDLGRQLRDQWLYEFPLMPEGTYTYQQMASGREFKVSGSPRGVTKCIDWMNESITKQYDGLEMTGFEDLVRRQALDWLTIGRILMYAPQEGALEYLDPTQTFFDYNTKRWYSTFTQQEYAGADVFVSHAIPIGATGYFMAPLMPVVSTAMLAYLIQDHDKAAIDGRRIRDVLIVQGESLAENIVTSIQKMVNEYTEPDPTKHEIPVAFYESSGQGNIPADQMFARIGLSEIPQGFNRADFDYQYANRLAGALGLSLRHIWNSEKATNRALEEVQEARQAQKGPSYFVRNLQRIFNNKKIVARFGRGIRVSFIEEVDVQSREVNAKVLKMYAESVKLLNDLAPGQIDIQALLAFMQRDDILPSDIDLFNPEAQAVVKKPVSTTASPQDIPTPMDGNTQQTSDPGPQPQTKQKSIDFDLGYDEVVMDLNYRILERRKRVYSVEKAIYDEYLDDETFIKKAQQDAEPITPVNYLQKAQEYNLQQFLDADPAIKEYVLSLQDPHIAERAKAFTTDKKLTDDDHRILASLLVDIWKALPDES